MRRETGPSYLGRKESQESLDSLVICHLQGANRQWKNADRQIYLRSSPEKPRVFQIQHSGAGDIFHPEGHIPFWATFQRSGVWGGWGWDKSRWSSEWQFYACTVGDHLHGLTNASPIFHWDKQESSTEPKDTIQIDTSTQVAKQAQCWRSSGVRGCALGSFSRATFSYWDTSDWSSHITPAKQFPKGGPFPLFPVPSFSKYFSTSHKVLRYGTPRKHLPTNYNVNWQLT